MYWKLHMNQVPTHRPTAPTILGQSQNSSLSRLIHTVIEVSTTDIYTHSN